MKRFGKITSRVIGPSESVNHDAVYLSGKNARLRVKPKTGLLLAVQSSCKGLLEPSLIQGSSSNATHGAYLCLAIPVVFSKENSTGYFS
jgi:hypothetical protein